MNNNEQISQKIVDNYSSNTNYFNYDLEVTLNSALVQFEIRDIISIYIFFNNLSTDSRYTFNNQKWSLPQNHCTASFY